MKFVYLFLCWFFSLQAENIMVMNMVKNITINRTHCYHFAMSDIKCIRNTGVLLSDYSGTQK